MTDEQTGTVVSYVRYADGTLLEVLTATPNESGRFGRKKWIHVVRVRARCQHEAGYVHDPKETAIEFGEVRVVKK